MLADAVAEHGVHEFAEVFGGGMIALRLRFNQSSQTFAGDG